MLPVTEIPQVVAESAEHFNDVFSWHQSQHYHRYLTCLMTNSNVTVTFMAKRFTQPVSQRCLNRFLTEYEWDPLLLNQQRLKLLQENPGTQWKRQGVVALDDTLINKSGKLMPGAGKFYEHADQCYKHAQNIVTSHYTDWKVNYPLGFRQYYKEDSSEAQKYGFKTKIGLACELVTEAEGYAVAADTYVADSAFLCQQLCDHIETYDKNWLMGAKSDLLVRVNKTWIQLKEYASTVPRELYRPCEAGGMTYYVHTRTLKLHCLGRDVKVAISYDNPNLEGQPKFLITNNLRWERTRMLRTYTLRHSIEAFYRDAKQHLGLEGCQLRNLEGTHRHWMMVFTAYSILKRLVVGSGLTKRLKGTLSTLGDGCRYVINQVLDSLVMLIYQLALRQQTPEDIRRAIAMNTL